MDESTTPKSDPNTDRRSRLRARLRAEWIAGAEEAWHIRNGRPMTSAELEAVSRGCVGHSLRSRQQIT